METLSQSGLWYLKVIVSEAYEVVVFNVSHTTENGDPSVEVSWIDIITHHAVLSFAVEDVAEDESVRVSLSI